MTPCTDTATAGEGQRCVACHNLRHCPRTALHNRRVYLGRLCDPAVLGRSGPRLRVTADLASLTEVRTPVYFLGVPTLPLHARIIRRLPVTLMRRGISRR